MYQDTYQKRGSITNPFAGSGWGSMERAGQALTDKVNQRRDVEDYYGALLKDGLGAYGQQLTDLGEARNADAYGGYMDAVTRSTAASGGFETSAYTASALQGADRRAKADRELATGIAGMDRQARAEGAQGQYRMQRDRQDDAAREQAQRDARRQALLGAVAQLGGAAIMAAVPGGQAAAAGMAAGALSNHVRMPDGAYVAPNGDYHYADTQGMADLYNYDPLTAGQPPLYTY